MFDSLFGAEMPLAVRFFLAFLIVLALIGVTAWAVRRFGAGRLGTNTRGRQPRLAVIDYASVDGRRRLILVRRDNVEHLLMIGGPTDVVVEPNIVRAVAAPRDIAATRAPAGLETLPRAIPLPENGNGSWPLQPEPAGLPSRPAARVEPLPDEPPARPLAPAAELPPRPQRDTLAALADELSTRPAPTLSPSPIPTRPRPTLGERKPIAPPATAAPAAEPPMVPASAAEPETAADQSLADMAQRLEAALRKPGAEARASARLAAAPEPEAATETLPPPPPRAPRPEPRPAPRAEIRSNQAKIAPLDNLEQEMANLLGRPPKT